MQVDLAGIGGSALTDPALAVPESPDAGIPVTYVPARNTMMLALALGWAEVLEATSIHVGVNAVDYSGYPDCRPEFIAAFETLAARATRAGVEGRPLKINAPLVSWTKAAIIQAGVAAGRGLLSHRVVLPGRRRRTCLRPLRFMPHSPRGLHGGRGTGPYALRVAFIGNRERSRTLPMAPAWSADD